MRRARLVATSSRVLVLALGAALAACTADAVKQAGEPSFYRSMAAPDIPLDAATAASMISGYRQNHGLGPVTLDPELMRLADAQARGMASRGRLDQNIAGSLAQRMRQSRFDAKTAGENISAGYHTFAEAFSGWRDSPQHRANMLLKGATRMGIAAVYAPDSKYKVFWTLIMAAPDDGRG